MRKCSSGITWSNDNIYVYFGPNFLKVLFILKSLPPLHQMAGSLSLRNRTLEDTRGDRDIEKLMMKSSAEEFHAKTAPTLLLSREVGNMYTASLYSGVASLLAT